MESTQENNVNQPATPTETPVATMSSPTPSSNKKTFMVGIGIIILMAVVVAGGVGTYRVYTQTARDTFSLAVARTLNLSIASVNGKKIAYVDYVTDLEALETMVAFDRENGSALNLSELNDEQKSDQVLVRLASNILTEELAKKYDVKVEQSDIDALKKQIITGTDTPADSGAATKPQFKTEEEASVELKKRYGWDYKTYEKRVMIPFILQNKLNKKISEDPSTKDAIKTKAVELISRLEKGEKFEDLARQYSEDPGSKESGGDLDWFGKGVMVPSFEEVAFKLKKGETTLTPVETPYGYHIIRVDDKGMRDATDPTTNKKTKTEQVKARHILIAFPNFDKIFSEFADKADVKVDGKVHDPFIKIRNQTSSSTKQ